MNKKILYILLFSIIVIFIASFINDNKKPIINNARIQDDGIYVTKDFFFFLMEDKFNFNEISNAKLKILANLANAVPGDENIDVIFELEGPNRVILKKNISLFRYTVDDVQRQNFLNDIKDIKFLHSKLEKSIITYEKRNSLRDSTGREPNQDSQKAIDECYNYITKKI